LTIPVSRIKILSSFDLKKVKIHHRDTETRKKQTENKDFFPVPSARAQRLRVRKRRVQGVTLWLNPTFYDILLKFFHTTSDK
jgi:hypothetical protein